MKKTSGIKLGREIVHQTAFWIALFVFGIWQHDRQNFIQILYYDIGHWIFQIIGANFIYSVLIRKFFERKKYVLFTIGFAFGIYLLGVLNRIFIVYAAEPLFTDEPQDSIIDIFTDIQYLLFHYLLPIISGAFIFISMKFMLRYKDEKQNTLQLQKEKSELELKVLRAQLNPHFLFNTLNNIYSLSITDPDSASRSISRLSDILDYILYQGQKDLVSVGDEFNIVKEYIALETIRYDERLKVSVEEKIDLPSRIPPLLYLSFVENAFKHGAEKTNGHIEIRISIETTTEHAIFMVENQFSEKLHDSRSGIGLENIKRQLELNYPNRYSLGIKKADSWFKVKLMTPGND